MKRTLEGERNLRLIQSEISDILTETVDGVRRVEGVKTHLGEKFECSAAVIASGTVSMQDST